MLNPKELRIWLNWFKLFYKTDDELAALHRMEKDLSDVYRQGYKIYTTPSGKMKVPLGDVETYNENHRSEHYTIRGCSFHIKNNGQFEIHGTCDYNDHSPHPNVYSNRTGQVCRGAANHLDDIAHMGEFAMLVSSLDEYVRVYSTISPYWRPDIPRVVCDGCQYAPTFCEMCRCHECTRTSVNEDGARVCLASAYDCSYRDVITRGLRIYEEPSVIDMIMDLNSLQDIMRELINGQRTGRRFDMYYDLKVHDKTTYADIRKTVRDNVFGYMRDSGADALMSGVTHGRLKY